jgi:hypothetical protein
LHLGYLPASIKSTQKFDATCAASQQAQAMQPPPSITLVMHVGMVGAHVIGVFVRLKMPAILSKSPLDRVISFQQLNGNVHDHPS